MRAHGAAYRNPRHARTPPAPGREAPALVHPRTRPRDLRTSCRGRDAGGRPDFAQAYREARRTALRREALEQAALAPPPRPKDPRNPGRTTKYTPETVETICERLGEGESLTEICADLHMPSMRSVTGWLRRYPEFRQAYMIARRTQADRIFDEVREVARAATPKDVSVARLNMDALRWQAAQLWPRRYGYYDVEEPEPQAVGASKEPQPWTVVIRQFKTVDGKVMEILTPKNAVSFADARQRAIPAPELDEEGWLARGGDPDWRDSEAQN
jgi:hypothetical protein